MALFASATDKGVQVLRDLHANRLRLETSISEAETELTRLRSGATEDAALDAFLTGPARNADGFPVMPRANEQMLVARLADLSAARPAICKRIRAAIVELSKCRAAALRKSAAKLGAELSGHCAKLSELRAALEREAGCRYVVDLQADGALYLQNGRQVNLARQPRPVTKADSLAAEIRRLTAAAAAIEERAADTCKSGGQISGTNLDELLTVCVDVERIAPSQAAIRQWYERAAAAAADSWRVKAAEIVDGVDARGRRYSAPEHDVVFSVAWDPDGVIVEKRSTATNRAQHAA